MNSNYPQPDNFPQLTWRELVDLRDEVQSDMEDLIAEPKAYVRLIQKYMDQLAVKQAKALLEERGKDHGSSTWAEADGVRVEVNCPQTVKWDGDHLYNFLCADYEQYRDIIKVSFSVPEATYNALPEGMRAALDNARTTKLGNPRVKVTVEEEEA